MVAKTGVPKGESPNMEKQMGGCMSGFFSIFDRNRILSTKRLPPPVTESLEQPSTLSKDLENLKLQQQPEKAVNIPLPPPTPVTVVETATKLPCKFPRETPRLSLDSRVVKDAKGELRPREIRIKTGPNSGNFADDEEMESHRHSPSIVARLMGLEPLSSGNGSEYEPVKKAELRRSASESRSRDYHRFFDNPSFVSPVVTRERQFEQSIVINRVPINKNVTKTNNINSNNNSKMRNRNQNTNQRRLMPERRIHYDTTDVFPPEVVAKNQNQGLAIKMSGIDEQSKDLETLKHILEAMQLKGLLHSSLPKRKHNRRFYSSEESPIVVMKSALARPTSTCALASPRRRRSCNCNISSGDKSVSPRRERPVRGENRSTSPVLRRKGGALSVETQVRGDEMAVSTRGMVRASSPVQSPRSVRRSDVTVSKSPRSRRSTVDFHQVTEDEVSTISESSFSNFSLTDNERWRVEEHSRDGRNLLERCDKLLNSIANITASSSSNSSELQQPSPVSVLDSSLYKEDESSPSPVKKRTIDFKDQAVVDLEDDRWGPPSSSQLLNPDDDIDASHDSELSYISEVIRASIYFPDDNDLFLLLEKQSSITGLGRDHSKASVLQRKLIFDTVSEILDLNSRVPPWKVTAARVRKGSVLDLVWTELQNIREQDRSEDVFEVVCGILKKDMAADDSSNGCANYPVEMSGAVLDIERLIFKDLIGESIMDLAVHDRSSCRKLVF